MPPPKPVNEIERLKALESYSIMDSFSEREYDSITQLAAYICETPIAAVSLIDQDRQWFKSIVGLEVSETPRDISFCQYTIMNDELFEVSDASNNEIFVDNPLVTGNPNIKFYAGAPLKDSNGYNLGALCVIDTKAKTLSQEQRKALRVLGDQVIILLQMRRNNFELLETQQEYYNFIDLSVDLVCIISVNVIFLKVNPAITRALGYLVGEVEGKPFADFIHPDDLEKTFFEVDKLLNGEISIHFENRFKCKNGQYIILSWNASTDFDTGNLYCIARDVTIDKQQQQKLISITGELTALLDAAEYSIISTELDGTIRQFNKGAEKLLGYKSEEVVGKVSPAIIHVFDEIVHRSQDLTIELGEKVTPGFDTIVTKARKLGIADSNEWTYIRKDGSKFPVILTITTIKNDLGEINGYLGIAKDITKEKEIEINLINSNKLLDETQSIGKLGSWKFDLITQNLVWSKGFYEILELDKLPEGTYYEAYRSRVHPEDLVYLDKLFVQMKKTGEGFHFKHRIIINGKVEKYVLGIGKSIRNEQGEVIGAQGTIQDQTEIWLAEKKLIENAKEIRDVRSALNESAIVAITDQKGIITYANDKFCSISKYSNEELVGQDHSIINSGYHSKEFFKDLWVTISNGKIWRGEIKNKAKDGSFYWVSTIIVPFLNNEGKPYQYVAIRIDITVQKLAENDLQNALFELKKNNEELDQFAYVVSHDLKAPLRAINNLAEWILEDMPEMSEEISKNFTILRGRVQRMENLINGVLDYSRIGRTKIEKEHVDIRSTLKNVVETIVPTTGFQVHIDDNMPNIHGEKILLHQIFSNLISNAVKYNDKALGKIYCQYKSLPRFHQFSIADNGPGIANQYHEKVFGIFQTIEARDKKESTGIGLSIVKKIIEEKGGTINIESEEDKGANFVFTIPK